MLPRGRRLTSDYDFRKVKSRGTRINTPFFTFLYLRKDGMAPSRFGFVVSTKVDKRATRRNRIKRLLSEGLLPLLSKVGNGYDIVFWVQRRALEAEANELWAETEKVIKQADLFTP